MNSKLFLGIAFIVGSILIVTTIPMVAFFLLGAGVYCIIKSDKKEEKGVTS